VRHLVRQLAAEGRTILLSSHLMSEMAVTADHLIVLGRGRVIADAPVAELISSATRTTVRVHTPYAAELADLFARPEVTVTRTGADALEIEGVTAAEIGNQAARAGIALHELTPVSASLEEAYMALTQNDVEYRTHAAGSLTHDLASELAPTHLQESVR
jgi:ABC-2 type transport system ATP-binding protein